MTIKLTSALKLYLKINRAFRRPNLSIKGPKKDGPRNKPTINKVETRGSIWELSQTRFHWVTTVLVKTDWSKMFSVWQGIILDFSSLFSSKQFWKSSKDTEFGQLEFQSMSNCSQDDNFPYESFDYY